MVGWARIVAVEVVIDGQHLEMSKVDPTGFSDGEDVQKERRKQFQMLPRILPKHR